MMNVGNPDRAFDFAAIPNHGVGLARLEFIINRMIGVHPKALLEFERLDADLKEQIRAQMAGYSDPVGFYVEKLAEGVGQIAAAFAPEPVIVRLSDFKSNEYANLIGGTRYEPHEENPMLGFRGASRYIDESFRPCFELECRAIRRVRETMGLTNVKVMVPFVRTLAEARAVTELLAANGLERGKSDLSVIMMCELPTNALLAEKYLQYFDGMSIGSNDMTQLTLGLDRDSAIVARDFDERDEAVRELLAMSIAACRKLHKYVGICGQGPSDHPDLARSPPAQPSPPDAARRRRPLARRTRVDCSAAREMADPGFGGLAIAVVEGLDGDLREGRLIEAAEIDAVAVGVGARHVERFHPAAAAEQVPGTAGIEAVLAEHLRAAQQAETSARHDQVQVTAHAADRAVTFTHRHACRGLHLEGDRAAVTAAAVRHEPFRH